MKKKLSYRDKLIELAYIYDVKEIKDYEKSRKNLTSGQLELILKKNKIIIPKDFKSNFLRDNFVKPVSKLKSNLVEFKENKIKDKNRAIRRLENFKLDTNRKISRGFKDLWIQLEKLNTTQINWEYTRGHAGDPNNERCDHIAQSLSRGEKINLETH